MISLTPLTLQELDQFYPLLQTHFPPSELKKLSHLHALYDSGVYDMWKLMADGEVKGLALLLHGTGCRYVLLDYLVMIEKDHGYGSACLKALQAQYPEGIMLEAEALLEDLPETVLHTRRRRLDFYRRAGWTAVPFRNRVFGEVYLIHLWAGEFPENAKEVCRRELYLAYRQQVPLAAKFDANVFIEGYHDPKEEKT